MRIFLTTNGHELSQSIRVHSRSFAVFSHRFMFVVKPEKICVICEICG
jgi:hypothetical protein